MNDVIEDRAARSVELDGPAAFDIDGRSLHHHPLHGKAAVGEYRTQLGAVDAHVADRRCGCRQLAVDAIVREFGCSKEKLAHIDASASAACQRGAKPRVVECE